MDFRQLYLQAHRQSRTSPNTRQSFVKELAKRTYEQKNNVTKIKDKINENPNGQLVTKAGKKNLDLEKKITLLQMINDGI